MRAGLEMKGETDGEILFIYLLTNWNNQVMYVGVTNDLERRIYEHKHKTIEGFTKKYNVDKRVYFETTTDVLAAIEREKQIKKWRREKKDLLGIAMNPEWKNLVWSGRRISPFS